MRTDDLGLLLEHLALNEVQAKLQTRDLHYWRDKQGHEVDLVWAPRGKPPVAIECTWRMPSFDPRNLAVFRRLHPEGRNLVVTTDCDQPVTMNIAGLEITFVGLHQLPSICNPKQN